MAPFPMGNYRRTAVMDRIYHMVGRKKFFVGVSLEIQSRHCEPPWRFKENGKKYVILQKLFSSKWSTSTETVWFVIFRKSHRHQPSRGAKNPWIPKWRFWNSQFELFFAMTHRYWDRHISTYIYVCYTACFVHLIPKIPWNSYWH